MAKKKTAKTEPPAQPHLGMVPGEGGQAEAEWKEDVVPVVPDEKLEEAVPLPGKIKTITIEVPIGELKEGAYQTDRIDLHLTRHKNKEAFRRMFNALHAEHATLVGGRHVDLPSHAIVWLLERVAEGIEKLNAE